jgi:hypothetical protein
MSLPLTLRSRFHVDINTTVNHCLGRVRWGSIMRNFNMYCDLKSHNNRIYNTYKLSMVSVISVNGDENIKDPLFLST